MKWILITIVLILQIPDPRPKYKPVEGWEQHLARQQRALYCYSPDWIYWDQCIKDTSWKSEKVKAWCNDQSNHSGS